MVREPMILAVQLLHAVDWDGTGGWNVKSRTLVEDSTATGVNDGDIVAFTISVVILPLTFDAQAIEGAKDSSLRSVALGIGVNVLLSLVHAKDPLLSRLW